MSGDAHRVRRLLWRIKLESPEEAFALRARLTRTVRTEILPEIERVFADLPSGDDLIHIERLQLTIRVADTDTLEQATVDAIRTDLPARRPVQIVRKPRVWSGVRRCAFPGWRRSFITSKPAPFRGTPNRRRLISPTSANWRRRRSAT